MCYPSHVTADLNVKAEIIKVFTGMSLYSISDYNLLSSVQVCEL